jgi:hypothetical protein
VWIFLACPEQPASGIPLAIKDRFDTAGRVTTYERSRDRSNPFWVPGLGGVGM